MQIDFLLVIYSLLLLSFFGFIPFLLLIVNCMFIIFIFVFLFLLFLLNLLVILHFYKILFLLTFISFFIIDIPTSILNSFHLELIFFIFLNHFLAFLILLSVGLLIFSIVRLFVFRSLNFTIKYFYFQSLV